MSACMEKLVRSTLFSRGLKDVGDDRVIRPSIACIDMHCDVRWSLAQSSTGLGGGYSTARVWSTGVSSVLLW